ncbi:acyl-CoA synthetase [Bailinhaonella thermotolerans]|uniref:Acyl-CoA synthetase n=1 Tax=Bailinhaonella thermotolerans TaxID=1070861 RepID=A0A3A4B0U4_9ACTN|nr:acyl-CoA synthetase [Bailinhaonella thermotolerans]RJL34459.1 acyl-CoA synthetase [Bailinhaonella thermotolerans]
MARCFNLADVFETVADAVPDRLALVAGDVRLTYAELDARANRVARHLRDAGVGPGAHVGVLAWNRAEWLETMIGCLKARAAPVNVNYRYVADELAQLLGDSDCAALVGERSLVARVEPVRERLPLLRHVVVIEDGGPGPDGDAAYEDALAAASPERIPGERSPDDPYILYTGGTTGLPKGVLWRAEDIFRSTLSMVCGPVGSVEELAAARDREPLRFQVQAPLMHGNGQWVTWNAMAGGNTVILWTGRRFDPAGVLELAARERTQILSLVGDGMAHPLAGHLAENPGAYDLSSLFSIGSGGAPLSPSVRDKLRAVLPDLIFADTFGGSETGAAGPSVEGAEGPPRFRMGPEFAVLGDDLRPVAPGSGERGVLARTGHIPLRYYKDEKKTAETFVTGPDGRRWALQGDCAEVDAEGLVVLLGRGSLVINTGGEKVFPEEVESVIRAHPAVYDAIVVGVPDPRFGQRVTAVAVPEPGATLTLDDLTAFCRGRLAGYKIPRALELAPEIPRTPVGKPDYPWARSLFPS